MKIIKRFFIYLCILALTFSLVSCNKQEIKNDSELQNFCTFNEFILPVFNLEFCNPEIKNTDKNSTEAQNLCSFSEFILQAFSNIPVLPKETNDTVMTIERARFMYVSSYIWPIIYPPNDFSIEKYQQFSHKYVDCEYYDCYIFDLKGYDTLKFYLYVTKAPKEEFYKDSYNLLQTLFVDEALMDTDREFYVGDNVEDVKKLYPDLQLFKDHMCLEDEVYYFEILNRSGIYCYSVIDNVIISKGKLDIMGIVKIFSPGFSTEYLENTDDPYMQYIKSRYFP